MVCHLNWIARLIRGDHGSRFLRQIGLHGALMGFSQVQKDRHCHNLKAHLGGDKAVHLRLRKAFEREGVYRSNLPFLSDLFVDEVALD